MGLHGRRPINLHRPTMRPKSTVIAQLIDSARRGRREIAKSIQGISYCYQIVDLPHTRMVEYTYIWILESQILMRWKAAPEWGLPFPLVHLPDTGMKGNLAYKTTFPIHIPVVVSGMEPLSVKYRKGSFPIGMVSLFPSDIQYCYCLFLQVLGQSAKYFYHNFPSQNFSNHREAK